MKDNLLSYSKSNKRVNNKKNEKFIFQSLDEQDNKNNYSKETIEKSKIISIPLLVITFIVLFAIVMMIIFFVLFKKNQNESITIKSEDSNESYKELKKIIIDLREENKKIKEEFKKIIEELKLEYNNNMKEINQKIEDAENKIESQIYKRVVGPIINGIYIVHSVSNPELVWDLEHSTQIDGARLSVYPKHGNSNQQFYFIYNPSDQTYTIYSFHSKKAIEVENGSKNYGTKIQQYPPNNTGAQKWIINEEGNANTYSFKNIASENYIDIKENGELVSNQKNEKNNQKFTLELINPFIGF